VKECFRELGRSDDYNNLTKKSDQADES